MPTIYGTPEGFQEYHEERGNEIPATVDEADILAKLLVASEWIDNTFGGLFAGQKTGGYLQERQWPRIAAYTNTSPSYVFGENEIPKEVEFATYEAALRELVSPGSLLVDWTPGKYKRVSIDGAVSVEYAQFSSAWEVQKVFPIIEQLLSVLFTAQTDGNYSIYSSASVRG